MNWTAGLVGAIVATIITRARSPWAPVIGGVLGALLLERLFPQLREAPQAAFVAPLFELAGGIAAADGAVSDGEVATVEQWMQRLQLNPTQRQRAVAAFTRGREPGWRFHASCDSLRTFTHEQSDLRLMLLSMLAEVAAVDGHAQAQALLDAIAERLNVAKPTWHGFRSGAAAARQAADFAELEVGSDASDAEIKASYRTLIARHHPDRLPPDSPGSARRAASEKTSRLNAAYERIQRARGMN